MIKWPWAFREQVTNYSRRFADERLFLAACKHRRVELHVQSTYPVRGVQVFGDFYSIGSLGK